MTEPKTAAAQNAQLTGRIEPAGGKAVPSKRFQETVLVHVGSGHDWECTACKAEFAFVWNALPDPEASPKFCPACGRRAE